MKLHKPSKDGPSILVLDIETAPILGYVWKLWDQNVGLNQIKEDWYVLSWAAKWRGAPASEVMYMDQRARRDIEDDSILLKHIWKLLDQADIVITQNGVSFDVKKLNARFLLNGMPPPSPYKNIDTCLLAKKKFGFTSNKLEYLTDKLCTRYKKLKHNKFQGFELWSECLRGNSAAWREMERYNKYDVLALEELYDVMEPWDRTIDFNLYHDGIEPVCRCGCTEFHRRGYHYTAAGKFQIYRCRECGACTRSRTNLLSRDKRRTLRSGV